MLRLDNAQADRQMLQEKEKKKNPTHSECKVMGQGRSVEVCKDGVLEVWKFETCSGAKENHLQECQLKFACSNINVTL